MQLRHYGTKYASASTSNQSQNSTRKNVNQFEKIILSLPRNFEKIQIYNWQISSKKTKMTTISTVGNLNHVQLQNFRIWVIQLCLIKNLVLIHLKNTNLSEIKNEWHATFSSITSIVPGNFLLIHFGQNSIITLFTQERKLFS